MDSSASITLDDSRWPLLVARFVGVPSLQQQGEYFRQLSTYLRRKEKLVGILDTREVRMMTAEHRHNLAGFVREHDALIRAQVLGCAAVITSPVMQLATSIVLHLIPMPFPYFTTSSMSEAVGWTTKRLVGSGYGPPPDRCLGEERRQVS
ncbi:hypothetical protein JRI60_07770 [Archangium violaceum]|uniref:hypothetical protein n=1 Tax=Archangium violaceum TaxID=83451 RepID=UPI001950BB5E|nr:hypothetical protein [Archangium violaceum]QRN98918.1 hypothetical protein JRI60_07770 [Archangium violaceum]